MALFDCISKRAVQDSIMHQNELHPINFLSQAINWSLTNDLSAKLMTGLEETWVLLINILYYNILVYYNNIIIIIA